LAWSFVAAENAVIVRKYSLVMGPYFRGGESSIRYLCVGIRFGHRTVISE
jgi:hypothetical protein